MTSCILLAMAVNSVQTTPTTDLVKVLDALEVKGFRGVIYVEREGKEAFFHAVGPADPESKRAISRSTGIEIGSIVKPMVGTAVYKLAEEGKLNLIDSISKYFNGVGDDKQTITIDMLLNHRSGFQDTFGNDYEPMKRDDLMKLMLNSKLIFAPGARNKYSNSGYSMLATIVEKVSHEPLEQHISKTEFQRLKLTHTGYVIPKWNKRDIVVGLEPSGKSFGTPLDHFWFPDGPGWNLRGNGGMITTVGELAKWCYALHNGQLMKPESYRLFAPAFSAEPPPDKFWWAAGGNGVFNCVLAYNPAKKLTLVAFSANGKFEIEKNLKEVFPLVRKL